MDKLQEKPQLEEPVKADVVDLKNDILTDIDIYIKSEFGVDDNTKIHQSQFNVSLMYIRDKYIYYLLHTKRTEYQGYVYKDDGLLKELLDIYIYLCQRYNKHICFYGYECLTGIEQDIIKSWLYDKKASTTRQDIAKKIYTLDEESLADFLTDGRRNPVGVVAVLNNRFGWSDRRITHVSEKPTENLDTIADKIGVNLLNG